MNVCRESVKCVPRVQFHNFKTGTILKPVRRFYSRVLLIMTFYDKTSDECKEVCQKQNCIL